jgi:hypothetical protein
MDNESFETLWWIINSPRTAGFWMSPNSLQGQAGRYGRLPKVRPWLTVMLTRIGHPQ